jgi:thiamine biosynthesis protein ThiI
VIEGSGLDVAETVSRVFGVASSIPAVRVINDFDAIINTVGELAASILLPGQTFAIDCRRVGNQEYSSRDVEVAAGNVILNRLGGCGVSVDLDDPEVTIYVEARDVAYIYHQVFPGPRGFPFGSQGRLVALFSGGIDSPVAAWLMMKRGAEIELLFMDQRPFVGDNYYARAVTVAKKLSTFVPLKDYFLTVASMGTIMQRITECVPPRYVCIVCKRMMYRVACSLADRDGADGIVTGESLGQVASQTLSNLKTIDGAVTTPVYRPLIGLEKLDSIALAKKIGTYKLSTSAVSGCTVVPRKPVTKSRANYVSAAEEGLDVDSLVIEAVNDLTYVRL